MKDRDKKERQLIDAVKAIISTKTKFLKDFNLLEDAINVAYYYEIGKYDIELKIEGPVAYILELLLNIKYGLANVKSSFYQRFVFDSRTTWKKPIDIIEE